MWLQKWINWGSNFYLALFIFTAFTVQQAQSSSQQFSIYCTSNFDGTGKCTKDDGNELTCISLPGQIIACKNTDSSIYECIQYGNIVAHQSQFVCEEDTDRSVSPIQFNSNDQPSEEKSIIINNPFMESTKDTTDSMTEMAPPNINNQPESNINANTDDQDIFINAF